MGDERGEKGGRRGESRAQVTKEMEEWIFE